MLPESERLLFRELVASDLDFVSEMLSDPEVMRYYPSPLSREESSAWIERQRARYARDGSGLWLVLDRATEQARGQVGLVLQGVDGEVLPEVGYLIHRPFWRRGLASEAALATRDWAFSVLGAGRVISLIRDENLPSQAVARKMGMSPWRRTLRSAIPHGVFSIEAPAAPLGAFRASRG